MSVDRNDLDLISLDRESIARLVRSIVASELSSQRQKAIPPSEYARWPAGLSLRDTVVGEDAEHDEEVQSGRRSLADLTPENSSPENAFPEESAANTSSSAQSGPHPSASHDPARINPKPDSLPVAGLALDSLERLAVAGHLNQFFHLFEVGVEDYLLTATKLDELVDVVVEGQREYDACYTLFTSGSTGTPKPCDHSKASLFQEVQELAGLMPDRRRVVGLVPCHHIYGFLFTVWLPKILGVPFLDGRTVNGSLRHSLQPGDLIIAVPSQWHYLQTSLQGIEDVAGVTATAPCSPDLGDALRGRCLSWLLEVFGSSETGGIGWRRTTDTAFTLFSFWQTSGIKAPDRPVTSLTRRYGDEVSTVPVNDRLDFIDDRHFLPLGRVDNAVQIGGYNVFPDRIAEQIAQHPDVSECAVRLDGEDRLKAFVVPADEIVSDAAWQDAFARNIRTWCSDRLKAYEIPARFTFGGELPRNEIGKSKGWTDHPAAPSE